MLVLVHFFFHILSHSSAPAKRGHHLPPQSSVISLLRGDTKHQQFKKNISCVLHTLFTKHTVINLEIVTLNISSRNGHRKSGPSYFQGERSGSSILVFRKVTKFSDILLVGSYPDQKLYILWFYNHLSCIQ